MSALQNTMKKTEDRISLILEGAVSLAFAVIVVLTVLLVILRYLFNSGIIFGNELIEYLFIYTTAFGAVVSLGKGEHIKIDYFKDKLKPFPKLITDITGQLIIAAINIVIALLSLKWIKTVGMSESPVMRIPMWTVQICIPLGCFLAALFAGFNIYKAVGAYGNNEKGASL